MANTEAPPIPEGDAPAQESPPTAAERRKARDQARYRANAHARKEKARESCRRYYAANREAVRAKQNAAYNPEARRQYYEAHREEEQQRTRAYYRAHRVEILAKEAARWRRQKAERLAQGPAEDSASTVSSEASTADSEAATRAPSEGGSE